MPDEELLERLRDSERILYANSFIRMDLAEECVLAADEIERLRAINIKLYEACLTSLGLYEAASMVGLDRRLPGFDSSLEDLKAAIAQAKGAFDD